MILTFCGHADYQKTDEHEKAILSFLEAMVGDSPAEFYLGGYGAFDEFAYHCCKVYQKTHPSVKLVFVTPYLSPNFQKNHLEFQKTRYDAILYPELEHVPPKFAISHRNQWMTERADFVIAYVARRRGGAYQTYRSAKRKGKTVVNLAGNILEEDTPSNVKK